LIGQDGRGMSFPRKQTHDVDLDLGIKDFLFASCPDCDKLQPSFMDINKAYLRRIRRMAPARRLLIAIELTKAVREIAIKGIMDSDDVGYSMASKILRERLRK